MKTCLELHALLKSGRISSVALTERYLERIARLDRDYGAFLQVTETIALQQAHAADQAYREGISLGPLQGVPYAAKDLFDVAGVATMAGCDLLSDNIAHTSATVIQNLSDTGMVLLGKTRMVQFAHGSLGINLNQGTPRNPWSTRPFVPGGSSSGSAVAVAMGMAPIALGTDTGGSVRVPASLCGMIGLKTTYGMVSRQGVYPSSSTLDSVGIIGTSADDITVMLRSMCGTGKTERPRGSRGVEGMRFALADSLFADIDEQVNAAVMGACDTLARMGATVTRIAFSEALQVAAINPDGLISGVEGYTVNQQLLATNSPWLDQMVQKRLAAGATVAATDYYAALGQMAVLRMSAAAAMAPFDALLAPSTPTPAVSVAECCASGDAFASSNARYALNTRAVNLLGLCALSMPCGLSDKGFPIGLQIIGKPHADEHILGVAQALMEACYQNNIPLPPGADGW